MTDETQAPPPGAAEPPPAAAATAAEPSTATLDARIAALEIETALERERWLRERFAREHQVLLSMMRLLVSGVNAERRMMRFWRWLIDDYRSERRLLATMEGVSDQESLDLARVLAWFRSRGFGRASSEPGA